MADLYLTALRSILEALAWDDAPLDRLSLDDGPNVSPTPMPIEDMAAGALAAVGLAAEAIWEGRGGTPQTVTVDRCIAGLSMESYVYQHVDGVEKNGWDPVTGFYATRDGNWVYLHANFPHLRQGLLEMLNAESNKDAVAEAVAGWDAAALEAESIARGLCATVVRDRDTWAAHEHRKAVAALPLVEIERIGEAPPEPLSPATRPLEGIRMLDLSRVIAGPMAGRTLVEHGATVMRVASPELHFSELLVINTGLGKRSCYVDLNRPEEAATLRTLVGDADVFLDGYRPGALENKGFGAEELLELRPGIVSVSLDAWSRSGPWWHRRGFDTLLQAATGFARMEADGTIQRLPCQPLDYITGYLAAASAMVALRRRADEGGSWSVRVSLARTAEWVWEMADLLGPKSDVPASRVAPGEAGDYIDTMASPFGELSVLRPALRMSETPPRWASPPVPLGTHDPVWP